MPSLVLTPKTSSKSATSYSLPTSDNSKASVWSSWQDAVGGGVASMDISTGLVAGQRAYVKFTAKHAGTGSPKVRIADSSGNQLAVHAGFLTTAFVEYIVLVTIGTVSDWATAKIQYQGDGGTITLQQDSIKVITAEYHNLTDVLGIKYNVDNLYVYGAGEAINGVSTSTSDDDFTTIPINGVVTQLVFSANSGTLLFTWDGATIGVEA